MAEETDAGSCRSGQVEKGRPDSQVARTELRPGVPVSSEGTAGEPLQHRGRPRRLLSAVLFPRRSLVSLTYIHLHSFIHSLTHSQHVWVESAQPCNT